MSDDAGQVMKARLRADLKAAMKNKDSAAVRALRTLIAALDNAEAVPVPVGQKPALAGSSETTEVERLLLGQADVERILRAEIAVREQAAAEMERLGKAEHAAELQAEIALAKRYLP